MNKSIIVVFSVLVGVAAASSDAASLSLTKSPANGSYQIYLNGESTMFDTFSFRMNATSGGFTNLDIGFNGFVPRGLGEPFTYINRYLAAHPVQGGMGLTLVGEQSTTTALAFDALKWGGKVDTSGQPGGRLFLANVMLSPTANIPLVVQLIAGGPIVQTLTYVRPLDEQVPYLPEPSSAWLMVAFGTAMFSTKLARRVSPTRFA